MGADEGINDGALLGLLEGNADGVAVVDNSNSLSISSLDNCGVTKA